MTTQEVLNLADQCFHGGKAEQAEAICRQVLAKLPEQAVALNLLGMILAERRRFDEAIGAFERLVSLRPDLPDTHGNLALALHQAGQLDLAEAACRGALAISPKHFGALVSLGNVLYDKSVQRNDMPTLDAAIAAFQQVAALRPDWGYAHFNLANALSRRGKTDQALAAYRTAAALLPADANIQVNLAIALHELGEVSQAAAAYTQILKMAPDEWRAMNNLGRLLLEAGKWEAAVDLFERALAVNGDVPEIHKNLAQALTGADRNAEAMTAIERIMARWPADPEPFWNLCRLRLAERSEPAGDFPYRGDKVFFLHCTAQVRRQLGELGLHGGYLIDPDTGADRWLAVQAAARHPRDVLHRHLSRWLENLRDEAAMSGRTAAVLLTEMPAEFVELAREIAGSDGVDIRGEDINQINAQLATHQAPPPEMADQFWAIVSIRNGGLELLPHWLEHYQKLGCHRMLIGLFDDLQPAAMAEIERCKSRWNFHTFPQRWEGEGYDTQYAQRRSACRRAGAVPGTWIINTDLDEFHQFPAPLAEIGRAAAAAGITAIHGRFADRVAADGSFPGIAQTPAIWEQFPIECDLSGSICHATTQKVMLSRYSVRVNPCHHEAANAAPCPPPLGKAGDYKVAHFKWHGGLPARLRWGLEQPNASAIWKRETRRLLAWLDRHKGRIDLDDPAIEAHRSI